ncbi:hypothetical protein Bpfe_021390 [Biomphalaria pfeifferi]|uniref:Uncharacterized protein n=1 Tax=Biomphalaria pfeifferi TaxID=112525 RepID=A0AAD8B833_BIOPF|nr:hypothetical protein Bpfe_021390 [Biomphalaria pfeifferi]
MYSIPNDMLQNLKVVPCFPKLRGHSALERTDIFANCKNTRLQGGQFIMEEANLLSLCSREDGDNFPWLRVSSDKFLLTALEVRGDS